MIIEKVQLYTTKVEELRYFYGETLGMKVSDVTEEAFALQAGTTEMIFRQWNAESAPESDGTDPFYHYAWMIPTNRFKEAKQWAASRVTLSREEDRDETYSNNWDSHSLYFEDPAGNIVELIAHHLERNERETGFSETDILHVCEIGLVSEDVLATVEELEQLGLARFGEGSDTFSPVGDRSGLFITVKKGRVWFFSTQKAKIYPLEATVRGVGKIRFG